MLFGGSKEGLEGLRGGGEVRKEGGGGGGGNRIIMIIIKIKNKPLE